MSAPYAGKRVAVSGTSRADLNGAKGLAVEYDRDKGRYTVRLDNGQTVALKPGNLEPLPEEASSASSNGSTSNHSNGISPRIPWQTVGLVAFVAYLLVGQWWQSSGGSAGSGGLWGNDDVEYDDRDEGYLHGHVRDVGTLDQLRGALSHHSENTGLPVIVDFFSHSCGPCRMIAPAFKRLAKEYAKQAVFLKVDVNRNYEASAACHIRGLPTFQFYLNKKKVSEFSGADERALRRSIDNIVLQAEDAGIFAGQVVTAEAFRAFYEAHDSAKVEEASKLAEKYEFKTAQLIRVCRQKYGATPEVSDRKSSPAPSVTGARQSSGVKSSNDGHSDLAGNLAGLSVDELRSYSERLRAELQRRSSEGVAAGGDSEEGEDVPFVPAEDAAGEGVHTVAILGGGPAGLAAATYAARAGLKPLVLAPAFGGQLMGKGVDVENYPGVVGEHATGRGLVEVMRRQAHSFDARFVDTSVLSMDLDQRPFRLHVNGSDQPLVASTVILACGAESRWLRVEGEEDFRGRGVSACATCDGFLYRDKDVAVVGGGDHAMEDALHLARTSRTVTLIHRRDSLRASKILADRVLGHRSISVRWNSTVEAFHGGEGLTHITVRSTSGSKERLSVAATFVAIGHEPQTEFLRGKVELDTAGYVVLHEGSSTSVQGVFAAGDIADRTYRQAITASGMGARAALDAERFLNAAE